VTICRIGVALVHFGAYGSGEGHDTIADLRNDLATNVAKLDTRRWATLFLKDLFTVKREY
jgi:hypothetical protein